MGDADQVGGRDSGLDHPIFDGDNHYYEAIDAFTRHLDPRLGSRIIQWCEIGGHRFHVIGGKVNHAVVNPTFDPVSPAGAMSEYFRGNRSGRLPSEYLRERGPIKPEYRDRDARLARMDEQGLSKIWLFPTLGMLYEQVLHTDPEGVGIMFKAFNRWLQEDWGFNYQNRIFAAPYISLADIDAAVTELEFALDHGATVVVMRAAAPTTALGQTTPGDELFDPFWARVNEAGITVVVHAGDSGYALNGYGREAFMNATGAKDSRVPRPNAGIFTFERAVCDYLSSLLFDKLFDRFPNLRVASVENGSDFLPHLFSKVRSAGHRSPGWFSEDPVTTFRRHIWMNPFWEDDVNETVECIGAERVIFGSDWPHIEGMPEPLDYLPELAKLTADEVRQITLDNVEGLNTPQPL